MYFTSGIFFVLPCIESYTKVDLRTVSFNVPPQEILTKDSVTTSVDAVVYYRVSNATRRSEDENSKARLVEDLYARKPTRFQFTSSTRVAMQYCNNIVDLALASEYENGDDFERKCRLY
ncbi:hypothetical protein NECAME_14511 [Necator americanus]|uniref:Band 7 domain-containing protein n=1 Tax=Necator americanus TaxID=51031 RepID=W2SQ76_NECAM|nr:hypothetical protein NECAME_14511 [Necator americanus]ETN70832.1 hypothetical protein NECAME_14511 [Necator americanus]